MTKKSGASTCQTSPSGKSGTCARKSLKWPLSIFRCSSPAFRARITVIPCPADAPARRAPTPRAGRARFQPSRLVLLQHADRARYPQVADTLRRLSEIESRHAAWLRDRLALLGAAAPAVDTSLAPGGNQWQRAVVALQAAQRKRKRLIEQIVHWDPEEPETVDLLRRIEQEDGRAHETYEGLIMRSDPHAID